MKRDKEKMYYSKVVQKDMEELSERKELPIEELKGKKIMVTGANGMLATYLVYFFMYLNDKKNSEIEVYALARNEEKAKNRFGIFEKNEYFHLILGDVCEKIEYDINNIDFVIHAAGNASPKYITSDPVGIIKSNVIGTLNILEYSKKWKTTRVLFTSTREVYGAVASNVSEIRECDYGVEDPTNLRSCYPESKRMAETLLESYKQQFGIDYVTVRIAHSYGPGMNINQDGRVMADFISDIVNKRDIVLKSTGEAERAFCYITDAISGMLIALLNGKSGKAYNLANEKDPMKIRDVAQMLTKIFKKRKCEVIYKIPEQMSVGYSKIARTKLCTDELEQIGWKCRVSLEKGLKNTVLSYSE